MNAIHLSAAHTAAARKYKQLFACAAQTLTEPHAVNALPATFWRIVFKQKSVVRCSAVRMASALETLKFQSVSALTYGPGSNVLTVPLMAQTVA